MLIVTTPGEQLRACRTTTTTASDQPNTWVKGAMYFLRGDLGEKDAEAVVALVGWT